MLTHRSSGSWRSSATVVVAGALRRSLDPTESMSRFGLNPDFLLMLPSCFRANTWFSSHASLFVALCCFPLCCFSCFPLVLEQIRRFRRGVGWKLQHRCCGKVWRGAFHIYCNIFILFSWFFSPTFLTFCVSFILVSSGAGVWPQQLQPAWGGRGNVLEIKS